MKFLLCVTLLVSVQTLSAQWIKQDVATTASFRGLSVVNEKVIWASGTGGTVIRTIDGGKKWDVIQVPDAAKLDFRDIEAFDANTAYILSIGDGESSRIYKTTDGGKTWKEQFRNTNKKAFFDAIACWTAKRCIAMSDPVDGHYVLIETLDGSTWNEIKSNDLPAAKDGQAAFAASGTCLITQGSGGMAYLVSGGTDAVVYRSYDYGRKWAAAPTPIAKGTQGSGIFSIAMWNGKVGFIVGGNYEKPNEKTNVAASTPDGARTWKPVEGLSGYRSAVAYVDAKTLIAVGTNGSDISLDSGRTWEKLGVLAAETKVGDTSLVTVMVSPLDLNAVASKGKAATFSVGPKGGVYKLK
ncbi:MAG TPA: hypothetical protein PKA82_11930 [Pyrinomonadaceae bacterium]|nr:hypothetical protein [Pyrinomonadaceae bacterium]